MRPEDINARIDAVHRLVMRDCPGRGPMTDGQRQVLYSALERAEPFTTAQRLELLRMLRTSENWPRLKASILRRRTGQ